VSTAVILPLRRKISRKDDREWTRIDANAREWIRLLKAYGAIRQPPDETTNESAFSRGRGTPARQAADEHRLTQIKEGGSNVKGTIGFSLVTFVIRQRGLTH